MSYAENISKTFLPLRRAAVHLGVPDAWLRAEADAGRVPHLRVGRQLLFNLKAVERALLLRAANFRSTGAENWIKPGSVRATLISRALVVQSIFSLGRLVQQFLTGITLLEGVFAIVRRFISHRPQ